MTQKRRKFSLNRRRYDKGSENRQPSLASKPDIISIWEEQKRIRDEEAQLQRDYEQAKARLKDLKAQIKQKDNLLSDIKGLDSTLYDDIIRILRTFGLWLPKTYKRLKLKATISYIKLRARLGVPMTGSVSFGREKLAMFAIGIILAGVAAMLMSINSSTPQDDAVVASANSPVASQIPTNQTPEFAVLTPSGQGVAGLGGFAKVSPEGKAPVYAYVDEIEKVRIRVSQQELPDKFKNGPAELEKMAKDFNANRTIKSDIATVYIGQSLNGPQSLLFQKDNLLVLIASDQPIADSSWQQYLSELKI